MSEEYCYSEKKRNRYFGKKRYCYFLKKRDVLRRSSTQNNINFYILLKIIHDKKFTAPFISVSKIIRDFNSNLEGKDIVYSRSAYRYREWKYVETNKLNLNVVYFENKLFSYEPIIDNFTFNNKQKIKTFEKNNYEIYNEDNKDNEDIYCNETLSDPEMDYCLNDSFFDNVSNISDISLDDIEKYELKSNQKIFCDCTRNDENKMTFSEICLDNNNSIITEFYS